MTQAEHSIDWVALVTPWTSQAMRNPWVVCGSAQMMQSFPHGVMVALTGPWM